MHSYPTTVLRRCLRAGRIGSQKGACTVLVLQFSGHGLQTLRLPIFGLSRTIEIHLRWEIFQLGYRLGPSGDEVAGIVKQMPTQPSNSYNPF